MKVYVVTRTFKHDAPDILLYEKYLDAFGKFNEFLGEYITTDVEDEGLKPEESARNLTFEHLDSKDEFGNPLPICYDDNVEWYIDYMEIK